MALFLSCVRVLTEPFVKSETDGQMKTQIEVQRIFRTPKCTLH